MTASVSVDQNDDDDDCSMLDYSIDGEALTTGPEAEQLSISQRELCFGTVSVPTGTAVILPISSIDSRRQSCVVKRQ